MEKPKYCTECGKAIISGSISCTNCGQTIDTSYGNNWLDAIGCSPVKNWLNSLSGWYRLYIIYACIHLTVVIIAASKIPRAFGYYSTPRWEKIAECILIYGVFPIVGVFFFGLAVRWAIKGFSKEK